MPSQSPPPGAVGIGGIKLAVAILPGSKGVITLGLKTVRDQLQLDIMQGLKVKALKSSIMEIKYQLAVSQGKH